MHLIAVCDDIMADSMINSYFICPKISIREAAELGTQVEPFLKLLHTKVVAQ